MIVALVFDAVVFFFQAEDGIRDGHVTGVQTCALPICGVFAVMFIYPFFEAWLLKDKREHHILDRPRNNPTRTAIGVAGIRSEERRVGKAWRSWCGPAMLKKRRAVKREARKDTERNPML